MSALSAKVMVALNVALYVTKKDAMGGALTNVTRIEPPLPFDTPKGNAMAHFVIDYGFEHHLYWVTFIEETGECWSFKNTEVRLRANVTMRPGEKPL